MPVFDDAVAAIKEETQHIGDLLHRHRDYLTGKTTAMRRIRSGSGSKKKVVRGSVAAFSNALNPVQISEDEFYAAIDSAKKRTRPKGKGAMDGFAGCVAAAVNKLFNLLRTSPDYHPFFLTDQVMGLNTYAALTDDVVNAATRANWRYQFRTELSYGITSMMINVYGNLHRGTKYPDSLFVWKVPFIQDEHHAGRVAKVIAECREAAPKKVSSEAMKNADTILKGITNLSATARAAVRNYLFLGEADPDDKIADEYVDFVFQIAAGKPIEEAMIQDGRKGNSRGGKGIDATIFQPFWDCCKEVLLPDARVEERRHSSTMHASAAHSIPHLVNQVTDLLKERVESGKLTEMPKIPSIEWVRLQFIPNITVASVAAKFTGRLEVKRGVQSRTLRKEHIDQHWVNSFVRYHLEWMVELKKSGFDGLMFYGQDDKAKIPIGDEVRF